MSIQRKLIFDFNSLPLNENKEILYRPLANFFDGKKWLNTLNFPFEYQDEINDFFNIVLKYYPNRLVISFRSEHFILAQKGIILRRKLGYGDNYEKFFNDFGFYYDNAPVADFLKQNKPKEEPLIPYGVARNSLENYYYKENWHSCTKKVFDRELQKRINYICDRLLYFYPTRMVYSLNKNHKKFAEETLPKVRDIAEYSSNEDFCNDFGFEYVKLNSYEYKQSVENFIDNSVLNKLDSITIYDKYNIIQFFSEESNIDTFDSLIRDYRLIDDDAPTSRIVNTFFCNIGVGKFKYLLQSNRFEIKNGNLVKYFGNNKNIIIPADAVNISSNAFFRVEFETLSFENGSHLKQICGNAFKNCGIKKIDFSNVIDGVVLERNSFIGNPIVDVIGICKIKEAGSAFDKNILIDKNKLTSLGDQMIFESNNNVKKISNILYRYYAFNAKVLDKITKLKCFYSKQFFEIGDVISYEKRELVIVSRTYPDIDCDDEFDYVDNCVYIKKEIDALYPYILKQRFTEKTDHEVQINNEIISIYLYYSSSYDDIEIEKYNKQPYIVENQRNNKESNALYCDKNYFKKDKYGKVITSIKNILIGGSVDDYPDVKNEEILLKMQEVLK